MSEADSLSLVRSFSTALTAPSPVVSGAEAERIAADRYGIAAQATRLAGEKDDNFLLRTGGPAYFLKVAHAEDDDGITNLSTEALLWLEAFAESPVQRVVRATNGAAEARVDTPEGPRLARMTTFLAGTPMRHVPPSRALRENVGRALARLGQELRGFHHPSASRTLLWDLQRLTEARPILADLPQGPRLDPIWSTFDRFDELIRPRLREVRTQVVHNDVSADNTLVADDGVTIAGIIDFGDVVETQLVNDVAVAAASHLAPDADPMAPVIDLVRGYHEVEPLTVAELSLIYDLVRMRTVLRIVISEWRATRFPANAEYILRHTPRAWAAIACLPVSREPAETSRLIEACGLS